MQAFFVPPRALYEGEVSHIGLLGLAWSFSTVQTAKGSTPPKQLCLKKCLFQTKVIPPKCLRKNADFTTQGTVNIKKNVDTYTPKKSVAENATKTNATKDILKPADMENSARELILVLISTVSTPRKPSPYPILRS